MNFGEIVLFVVVAWSALSIVVALAVGGMAKARDTGSSSLLDQTLVTGNAAPPARDKGISAVL